MRHGRLKPELAKKIITIRKRIEEAEIPTTKLDETLIIGTWNIREFGAKRRKKDAIHLIAEVINQFDLLALTELRDNLQDLDRVLEILGPYWQVVYSDYRHDNPNPKLKSAGNRERMAFVFDKRVVRFTGLAAEANPPRRRQSDGTYELLHNDWWRSPYMASFRAGNFDFIMLAVHMRWGNSVKKRAEAIGYLADWVDERVNDMGRSDKDFIVLGDFNIPSRRSSAYKQLTKHSLQVPSGLMNVKGTNLTEKYTYDQIAHTPSSAKRFTDRGGVIRFYKRNHKELYPDLTLDQFKFQISDHLPLWMELDCWIEGEQLDRALKGGS